MDSAQWFRWAGCAGRRERNIRRRTRREGSMTVMSTGGSQRNAHVDGGDASDTIILDGKVYHLTSKPLEGHFQRISWRPAFIRRAPGGPYGYKARWEEFGGRLFLTGLFGMSWIVPPHLAG